MGLKTLHLVVDGNDPGSEASQLSIERAAKILLAGGTVAFPTETVYGLGANALDAAAVAGIFEAKMRPAWDPLIVHVKDAGMLGQVASEVPQSAVQLIDVFWPGPLTLLVPKHERVPSIVTAGRDRIGVRMPAHPVALELLRKAGVPIAAPSANTFGRTSPTSAAHVLQDLDGRVDAVLDAGETQHGLESTVVDTCVSPLVVYRPGVVTVAQIEAVCGQAYAFDPQGDLAENGGPESSPSPGLGIRHYAPRAQLVLVDGEGQAQQQAFADAVTVYRRAHRVGLMLPLEFDRLWRFRMEVEIGMVFAWGSWKNPEELAQRLFAGLRQLDAAGATLILCPLPAATGIGVAIRDRLQKAARSE